MKKNQTNSQRNKTLWLASFAVVSVLGAFVAGRLSNVVDLHKIEKSQQLIDKKPVYQKIAPEINNIDFRIPDGLDSPMKVTFKFNNLGSVDSESMANATKKAIKNESQSNKIEIKQVIDEDQSKYGSDNFNNIDLNKVDWKIVGDTLTIDLSASVDSKAYYHGEELLVTLPRSNWTISTSPKMGNALYFESIGEPIDLHIMAKGAKFSGNYANLTISQTARCNNYNNECFSIFKNSKIDKLVAYSDFKVDLANYEYDYHSSKEAWPFALTIEHSVQLNSGDFYMPKEAKIEMYNSSLFNKINWHEPKK